MTSSLALIYVFIIIQALSKVLNLVLITRLSLQILGKTQTEVFLIFGFLVKPFITPETVMIVAENMDQ